MVGAEFIWTEPHSKRLRVKITIQKEVLGVILQQDYEVVFVLRNQQCDECQASFTEHTWKALVQVRQRVDHKRTFLYLEQLIMKYNAHTKCTGIEQKHDGMDFQYASRSHGTKFCEFLHSVVPCRVRHSKHLVSQDFQSNVAKFKYAFTSPCALCHHV